jgi:hypothetical protein
MALVVRRTGTWKLEIVKRSDAAGFEVLPVDRREDLCLDQSQPSLGSRLRTLRRNGYLIHPPRDDPHHAQTARRCKRFVMNPNFSDGL